MDTTTGTGDLSRRRFAKGAAWAVPVVAVVAAAPAYAASRAVPQIISLTPARQNANQGRVTVTFSTTGASSYTIQYATNSTFTTGLVTVNGILVSPYTTGNVADNRTYYFRVRAVYPGNVVSNWSTTVSVVVPNYT